MMKETTWRPDTCGCEVVYSIDEKSANQEPSVVRFNSCCFRHSTGDKVASFNICLEENRKKNRVYKALLGISTASDGQTLNKEKSFDHSYKNDKLFIKLKGFTPEEKQEAKLLITELNIILE